MRILIAAVTAGAGHLQAAAALEEAWREQRPRDRLERLDVLEFTTPLFRKAYAEGYLQLVQRTPELWGFLFDRSDKPALTRKFSRWRRGLAKAMTSKFRRHLREFRPDAALCTHFLPLEILGGMKAKWGAAAFPFTASVVTDFEAHAFWMEPAVDLYCVAAEETRARLVARGADPARVAVTGIPIGRKFAEPVDRAATRRQLGLRDDLPTILILGGGFGMGPVAEILAALDRLVVPVQLLVVCGRNEELRREAAASRRRHPLQSFGFVGNMHELMTAADLVLTKPGGLTSSEALALGKPIVVFNPIPGQEAANSDFLLERGAAAKVNRVEDLPFRLERLLGSPRLGEMAAAARSLGRPGAAPEVCRQVLAAMGRAVPRRRRKPAAA